MPPTLRVRFTRLKTGPRHSPPEMGSSGFRVALGNERENFSATESATVARGNQSCPAIRPALICLMPRPDPPVQSETANLRTPSTSPQNHSSRRAPSTTTHGRRPLSPPSCPLLLSSTRYPGTRGTWLEATQLPAKRGGHETKHAANTGIGRMRRSLTDPRSRSSRSN
jgi:hypothetical protein